MPTEAPIVNACFADAAASGSFGSSSKHAANSSSSPGKFLETPRTHTRLTHCGLPIRPLTPSAGNAKNDSSKLFLMSPALSNTFLYAFNLYRKTLRDKVACDRAADFHLRNPQLQQPYCARGPLLKIPSATIAPKSRRQDWAACQQQSFPTMYVYASVFDST